MVSIHSTTPNYYVLAALRQINNDITAAQTRIGTGYKINGASDGAGPWAIAQSIRSDIESQDAIGEAISLSKARVDAGVAGLDKIADLLTKMQDVSAGVTTTNLAAAQSRIKSYQAQITAIIQASGFQGLNALTGASEAVTIGSDAAGTALQITMTGVNVSATGSALGLAVAGSTAAIANVRTIATTATTALTYVADYQATLSGFSASLDMQISFQGTLKSIKEAALSSLVDTDLETETAKIAALQVKQQLAYQALAITNAAPKNVLLLFQ